MEKDLPLTQTQRRIIEKWIDQNVIFGTKKGIDYLTREEASGLIGKVMADQRD